MPEPQQGGGVMTGGVTGGVVEGRRWESALAGGGDWHALRESNPSFQIENLAS